MSNRGEYKRGDKRKRGHGGKRAGAGRTPEWFKKEMAKIATRPEAIQLFKDVIDGKDVDEFITPEGEQVPVKPKAEVRLKFWAAAAERGFGKVTDEVNITSEGKTVRDFLLEAFTAGNRKPVSDASKGGS